MERNEIGFVSEFIIESDPNGKFANEPGAKLDAGKPPVYQGCLDYFPLALEAISLVSFVGAKKYSWKGWETVADGENRYKNAMGRHITKESTEGLYDIKGGSNLLHAAQRAWNDLAVLELMLKRGVKVIND